MPTYEFECPSCKVCKEVFIRITEIEDDINWPKCFHCGDGEQIMKQIIRTTPAICIPGHMTHDGITKVLIGKGDNRKKEDCRVPINIIDKKPDGSFKVTRIGNKKDIENE